MFIETDQLEAKEPREGEGCFFHSGNMTFAYYMAMAGAWIHEHSHPNDEVWNVIDGQLEITIADLASVEGLRRLPLFRLAEGCFFLHALGSTRRCDSLYEPRSHGRDCCARGLRRVR